MSNGGGFVAKSGRTVSHWFLPDSVEGYEDEIFKDMFTETHEDDVFFDIGAHSGQRFERFSQRELLGREFEFGNRRHCSIENAVRR